AVYDAISGATPTGAPPATDIHVPFPPPGPYAADFYATQFAGAPIIDPAPVPTYYSADYRLSQMETFTFGIEVSARITDWLTLDLAYKRYDMRGLDGVTSQSAYPKANIVTVGARLWF